MEYLRVAASVGARLLWIIYRMMVKNSRRRSAALKKVAVKLLIFSKKISEKNINKKNYQHLFSR